MINPFIFTSAVEGYKEAFVAAMDNDFNTREAIGVMFEMASASNRAMSEGTMTSGTALEWMALLREFDSVLGILPEDAETGEELDSVMSILIDLRQELRRRKMYDLADMVRDRVKEAGFSLEDSAEGARWKRL